MSDQINLKKAGSVVVPVGKGADRNLVFQERSRFGCRPSARQESTAGRREQAIRRCRAEGKEQGARRRIKRQFAMSFEGIKQIG